MHTHSRPASQAARVAAACLFLAATAGLSACTTAQMRVPDGFGQSSTVYPVTGLSPRRVDSPIRFGPYVARSVREGGTLTWSVPLGSVDLSRAGQGLAFSLDAGDDEVVNVACKRREWTLSHGNDSPLEVDLTELSGPWLECDLNDGLGGGTLALARRGQKVEGTLRRGDGTTLAVAGQNALEGSPLPLDRPAGFVVRRDGTVLAAVDGLNAGAVYLGNGLPEDDRHLLGAASVALLMATQVAGD